MLCPKDIQSIQHCVDDLEYVLKNWEYFEACAPNERVTLDVGDTTRGIVDVDTGLCGNVFDPNKLSDHIKLCMFVAWGGFSGDPIYPVDGMDEYESEDFRNLFLNSDRKALAVHCVEYLKRLLELL